MAGALAPVKEWFVPMTLNCCEFARVPVGMCITVCTQYLVCVCVIMWICTRGVWFNGIYGVIITIDNLINVLGNLSCYLFAPIPVGMYECVTILIKYT